MTEEVNLHGSEAETLSASIFGVGVRWWGTTRRRRSPSGLGNTGSGISFLRGSRCLTERGVLRILPSVARLFLLRSLHCLEACTRVDLERAKLVSQSLGYCLQEMKAGLCMLMKFGKSMPKSENEKESANGRILRFWK